MVGGGADRAADTAIDAAFFRHSLADAQYLVLAHTLTFVSLLVVLVEFLRVDILDNLVGKLLRMGRHVFSLNMPSRSNKTALLQRNAFKFLRAEDLLEVEAEAKKVRETLLHRARLPELLELEHVSVLVSVLVSKSTPCMISLSWRRSQRSPGGVFNCSLHCIELGADAAEAADLPRLWGVVEV